MNDDKYGANDRGLNTYNIRRKDELVKENERLRNQHTALVEAANEWFQEEPGVIQQLAGYKVLHIPLEKYAELQSLLERGNDENEQEPYMAQICGRSR